MSIKFVALDQLTTFIWEESKDKEERKSAAGLTSLDQSNNNKFGRWGSLRSSAVFGLFDLLRGGGAPRKPSRAQQQGKEAARGNTQRAMNSWK